MDDEEIDSDEAFDSEDERKYGDLFANFQEGGQDDNGKGENGSDHASDEDSEGEDDDEDEEAGTLLSDLLGGSKEEAEKQVEEEKKRRRLVALVTGSTDDNAEQERTESAHMSSASEYSSRGSGLKLSDLTGTLDDSRFASSVTKKLASLTEGKSALQAPVAAIVANRAERKVAYQESKKTVSNTWQDLVDTNRKIIHFDYAKTSSKSEKSSTAALASTLVPSSNMELMVDDILKQSRMSEKQIQEDEEAVLPDNDQTAEAIARRKKKLASLRHLMFNQELKNKRKKKIKSKTYHKIRRKQEERKALKERERLREVDPKLARELDEKDALERAKLRMTLKHRNSSKWTKKQLKRGSQVSKAAAMEQQRHREELHRKILESRDMDDSDSNSDDNDDLKPDVKVPSKPKGLMALKFMQRRAQAKEDEDEKDSSEQTTMTGRRTFSGPTSSASSSKRGVAEVETKLTDKQILPEHESHTRVSGAISVRSTPTTVTVAPESNKDSDWGSVPFTESGDTGEAEDNTSSSQPSVVAASDDASNPWLSSGSKSKRRSQGSNAQMPKKQLVDAIASLATRQDPAQKKNRQRNRETAKDKQRSKLVKRAFADACIAERKFDNEKERLADGTTHKKEIRVEDLPGWGSWTGLGTVPKRKPKRPPPSKRKKAKANKRKDKKLKHVILSEKHDKKAAMFKVRSIPYPFTSREQYERSLKRAIGKEWNTHNSVQSLTKPEVMTKAGVIIAPLKAPKRKTKQK